jgi:hypothetical protein
MGGLLFVFGPTFSHCGRQGTRSNHHFIDVDVCYWHKADIRGARFDVRYWVKSGHRKLQPPCPLMTQSGHWQPEFAVMHNAAPSMVG